ncbi:septal ring lytic transglycosylase RlpA family protein [Myroides sp. LJL115]
MYPRYILYIVAFFCLSSFTLKRDSLQDPLLSATVSSVDLVELEEEYSEEPCDSEEIQLEIVKEEAQISYYHDKFNGRFTASGEVFDNQMYTAAHKTLPFGTKIKVTNLHNQQSVILTVTDRGPFTKGRELDISKKAFLELTNSTKRGILNVKIEKMLDNEG